MGAKRSYFVGGGGKRSFCNEYVLSVHPIYHKTVRKRSPLGASTPAVTHRKPHPLLDSSIVLGKFYLLAIRSYGTFYQSDFVLQET
jgi:hypothetical protein